MKATATTASIPDAALPLEPELCFVVVVVVVVVATLVRFSYCFVGSDARFASSDFSSGW